MRGNSIDQSVNNSSAGVQRDSGVRPTNTASSISNWEKSHSSCGETLLGSSVTGAQVPDSEPRPTATSHDGVGATASFNS